MDRSVCASEIICLLSVTIMLIARHAEQALRLGFPLSGRTHPAGAPPPVVSAARHARRPSCRRRAADHHDRFHVYFFSYSYSGHTGREIDWIEVNVTMI
jgi:hypothetical protein